MDGKAELQRSVGERLSEWLARWEWSVLGLMLALVAAMALLESRLKPLWFDEIFTLLVAGQPSWRGVLDALPADGNPPLMHVLVRGLMGVLGPTAMAGRMPELVAFLLSCVLLHVLVRRWSGPVGGLLAVALMMVEPGWSYAFEARPYGLLLCFTLLAVVGWQTAAMRTGRVRLWGLAGVAVGVAGAILSHNVGAIETGLPLLLAEGIRCWRRRRMDAALLAAWAIGLMALLVTVPMARRVHDLLLAYGGMGAVAVSPALVLAWMKNAWDSLVLVISVPLVVLLGSLAVAGWRRSGNRVSPAEVWGLGVGAVLLLPVLLVAMELATRYFNSRYGIAAMAGVSVLGVLLLVRSYGRGGDVVVGLLVYTQLLFVVNGVLALKAMKHEGVEGLGLVAEAMGTPGWAGTAIVVANAIDYVPIWWYATGAERERLVYLQDLSAAERSGRPVPERAVVLEATHVPGMRVEGFGRFVEAQNRFLLVMPKERAAGEMVDRLRERGFRVDMLDVAGSRLYAVDR